MNKETLNKLKELAKKAETEVIRSHGWAGSVEMLDTLRTDEEYLTAASPAAILELIALAERTTSPVSQMTEHKGGDQIQRPGDKAESNQGHKPVLIDNDQLLVRKVHPAPVEGTFTREEARAAVLAVAAQPQPVAEQIKLMTMQEVIDAMHSNNLLTDIGYNALLNGDSLNATLEYITQVINFAAIPTIHAARVAIQQPQDERAAKCQENKG